MLAHAGVRRVTPDRVLSFRAPNPIKAARRFAADYDAVVAELASNGVESQVARSVAGIASLGAAPIPTAHKLLQNFEDVVRLGSKNPPVGGPEYRA